MTEVQETLLSILAKALFQHSKEPVDTDWDQLLQEAKNQGVVQLAYNLIETCLPVDAKEQWNRAVLPAIATNIRVCYNHEMLHEWMTGAGIPYVVLKGCASAHYYPVPSYRTMGDVDFLVPTPFLEKASEVLISNGLKPWDEEHISHIVFRGPAMHFEMHFNVAGTPEGPAGEKVREYFKDIFDQSTVQKIDNGEAVLPSHFHHGLVLLLHTCHHLTGEGVGLRHLCDWAVFENRFSDEEFRTVFEDRLKQIGLWKFAQVLTRISIKHLGAEPRIWASSEQPVDDMLLEDILASGNFGRKDTRRSGQAMLISNRGKDGIGRKGMLRVARDSADRIVYQKWPFARKVKILLPIGWLFFSGRRVIRELTGKRKKTDIRNMVAGAAQRRQLYQELHLYEKE